MISKVLLGLAAIGLLLVGYNAFLNSDSSDSDNATSRLSSSLSLDQAAEPADEDTVAVEQTEDAAPAEDTSDSQTSEDATTETEQAPAESEPAEDTSADSEQSTDNNNDQRSFEREVYTVQAGDAYGCIAEKHYGSYEHWVDIYNANPNRQVGFTERGLHVGAQLVLPAVSAENVKPASSLCS